LVLIEMKLQVTRRVALRVGPQKGEKGQADVELLTADASVSHDTAASMLQREAGGRIRL
jgi:hypothetical protein